MAYGATGSVHPLYCQFILVHIVELLILGLHNFCMSYTPYFHLGEYIDSLQRADDHFCNYFLIDSKFDPY